MKKAFLESSVLIGLHFRHAGEKAACAAAIPSGAVLVCSRYVQFEIARGFLRSLIALHNLSLEFTSFADLHQAAHSGQRRFQPYRMHTWLGAMDDFEAALEAEDGQLHPRQKLEGFRAKLRGWVRRGWARLVRDFNPVINDIGLRDPLESPVLRSDGFLEQNLQIERCGIGSACGLGSYIERHRVILVGLADGLEQAVEGAKDRETRERIRALNVLTGNGGSDDFEGEQCHRCGDALIAMEVPPDHLLVTKNAKHFEPIGKILGKVVSIAQSSKSTLAANPRS